MTTMCLAFESRALIFNSHLNIRVHRFKASGASGGTHWMRPSPPNATQGALQNAKASGTSNATSSDAPCIRQPRLERLARAFTDYSLDAGTVLESRPTLTVGCSDVQLNTALLNHYTLDAKQTSDASTASVQ